MKKTKEYSETQAEIIKSIALDVILLDTEYCKEAAQEMHEKASMYDSAAVLMTGYTPIKSELMNLQADALMCLVEYIETLKKIDKVKNELSREVSAQNKINQIFGNIL